MKPSEEEQSLDALLRGGRVDPTAGDLSRLEARLSSHLGTPAPAKPGPSGRGMWKVVVFVAALGLVATPLLLRGAAAPIVAKPVAVPTAVQVDLPPPPTSEATVSVLDLPNAPAALPVHATPPPVASASATPPETETEASFLRRAQNTLASDPSAALALLNEHPSRYPQGGLGQEREVMAIDALARLGRMDEARTRAAAFEAKYPHSAHESRLEAILQKDQP